MNKKIFIAYLIGEMQKTLIDNLPDGELLENTLIDYSRDIIIKKFDHIRQSLTEAWLVSQKRSK